MIHNNFGGSLDLHLLGELATGQIARFLWRMAVLQLLGMGRPGASHEGPREAGIEQRRGCPDRVSWRPHPAAGSHLPAEGAAPPLYDRNCADFG
jgi:hypothetical protein